MKSSRAVESLPAMTRIERLLAMTLLELGGLKRDMDVKEQVAILGRAGFSITEAAEIIGTSRATIYGTKQRGRKAREDIALLEAESAHERVKMD
jgi:hypothetical protein